MQKLLNVAMFRTGDYGEKGKYGTADLDAMAASYDPDYLMAPITCDHEQVGRAFGWITRIFRQGDLLCADWDVHDDTYNLLREGQFSRRSVEFYKNHLMPDGSVQPYVKACSILGAATPHAKGLPAITFSELTGETISIMFTESLTIIKPELEITMNDTLNTTYADRLTDRLVHGGYYQSKDEARRFAATQPRYAQEKPQARKSGKAYSDALAKRASEISKDNPTLSYMDACVLAERELGQRHE